MASTPTTGFEPLRMLVNNWGLEFTLHGKQKTGSVGDILSEQQCLTAELTTNNDINDLLIHEQHGSSAVVLNRSYTA